MALAVDLTEEDLAIYQRLPLWVQAPSIMADRYDAACILHVVGGWRILGYRSVMHMLRRDVEHQLRSSA